MIQLVPLQYYNSVFFIGMFVICLLTSLYYYDSKYCEKLLKNYTLLLPLLFAIILIFYIGLRPPSWKFADMMLYQHRWNIAGNEAIDGAINYNSEWFFDLVLTISKRLVPDVQFWFLIIELFYIGCQFWACKKLLWENVWLAILFVFFSYQFYSYGTNGLRNGMACAIMLLAIAFFCDRSKIGTIIGIGLFILAMGCHRSALLPMAALLTSLFIVKDIKFATYIWVGCIVLSLIAGSYFQNLMGSLGFDDRASSYSTMSEEVLAQFSHVGFRWDFLLYSAMPVWLAWYVRFKGIYDRTFTLLATTYIIANSFWILICRVAFSNRFAYLSWFMYALVIAYGVVRVPIWKDQDRKAGWILLAHSTFTLFMFAIGK